MSKYIASFFSFLFPILRSAIVQVAADELNRLAYSGRRPKSRYNDWYQEQSTEKAQKPPLGLRPRFIVAEHRVREIDEAIQRYAEAGWDIPAAWVEERADLFTQKPTEET